MTILLRIALYLIAAFFLAGAGGVGVLIAEAPDGSVRRSQAVRLVLYMSAIAVLLLAASDLR